MHLFFYIIIFLIIWSIGAIIYINYHNSKYLLSCKTWVVWTSAFLLGPIGWFSVLTAIFIWIKRSFVICYLYLKEKYNLK